jgi:hypothetical protein
MSISYEASQAAADTLTDMLLGAVIRVTGSPRLYSQISPASAAALMVKLPLSKRIHILEQMQTTPAWAALQAIRLRSESDFKALAVQLNREMLHCMLCLEPFGERNRLLAWLGLDLIEEPVGPVAQVKCPACGADVAGPEFATHSSVCVGAEERTSRTKGESSAVLWQNRHPGVKMRRGGFDEPYCSDDCYRAAGTEIGKSYLNPTSYVCVFCQSQRHPRIVEADRPRAVFPYRGKLLAMCMECEAEAAAYVITIRQCCKCGFPM